MSDHWIDLPQQQESVVVDPSSGNQMAVNPDGSINVSNAYNPSSNSAVITSLVSSTSSQIALAANSSRKGFILHNNSTQTCYVSFANSSSTSAFSFLLNTNSAYQNEAVIYTGSISCVWASADGSLMITELL